MALRRIISFQRCANVNGLYTCEGVDKCKAGTSDGFSGKGQPVSSRSEKHTDVLDSFGCLIMCHVMDFTAYVLTFHINMTLLFLLHIMAAIRHNQSWLT